MKTREEYVRPYQIEFEEYVQHVSDVCKDAGYSSFDEAYDSIMSQPVNIDVDVTLYNGFESADRYWISTLGQGLYEYEKPLIKAHKRYDRIIERLASKKNLINNKVLADELFEMKRRDERFRARLEEANSRHDELIDELVSKYKTDVEEEDKNMICPECNSEKIIKFGYRLTRKGKIQRYQCQVCARVFTEPVNEERD